MEFRENYVKDKEIAVSRITSTIIGAFDGYAEKGLLQELVGEIHSYRQKCQIYGMCRFGCPWNLHDFYKFVPNKAHIPAPVDEHCSLKIETLQFISFSGIHLTASNIFFRLQLLLMNFSPVFNKAFTTDEGSYSKCVVIVRHRPENNIKIRVETKLPGGYSLELMAWQRVTT